LQSFIIEVVFLSEVEWALSQLQFYIIYKRALFNGSLVRARVRCLFHRLRAAQIGQLVLVSFNLLQRDLAESFVDFERDQLTDVYIIRYAFIMVVI
jgi:hypothetical protein